MPYPGGGIVDIVTRALADPMQADLGQTIVVEPKPGGNSTLATAMIPQAPADGYNWVMATISHVVVPHLQSVPYDPLTDFQPVALVTVATVGRDGQSVAAGQDAEGAGRVRARPIPASSTT